MKSDDGTNVDIKYLFPMNVPFALADFYYKIGNGTPEDFKAMDLVEALTGFKSVGSTSESLERIKEVASSMFSSGGEQETDQTALNKVSRSAGDLIGAWLGRATVPLNQVSDIISAFDSNEALPRDIYVTKPEEDRTFLTAVGKNIQKGIPLLKQALPEYQPATRTEAPFRDTGPLKQMTGLALVPPKNAIETEIEARKIPFNKIFSTTGDKTVDAEARRFMANNIDKFIPPIINMDVYKKSTDEGKTLQLTNALSDLQSKAKEVAIAQSIEKFYDMKKVPPIEQKQFESKSPKLRRLTLDFYKQQFGVSLESDPDFQKYKKALEISKELEKTPAAVQKPTEKATGGVVGYQVGGLAAKQIAKEAGSSAVMKSSMSLLKEMQDAAAKAAVKEAPAEIMPTPVVKEAVAKKPFVKNRASLAVSEPKPVDAEMEKLVSDAEASFTPPPKVEPEVVPEIKTKLPVETPSIYTTPISNTNLNKPGFGGPTQQMNADGISNLQVRKDTLSNIKVLRQESFNAIKDSPMFEGIEKDAIAVAQGDYRIKTGKEFNPDNPVDVENFAKFSKGYQKKLDDLREQYKDRPPEILIHGSVTERTPAKIKRGFFDPQTLGDDKMHIELDVGATSFTRDLRLNYNNPAFGGPVAKNISYTEIPYADYLFRRVDLPLNAYYKKDMNIIAQAITGDPTIARPMGLPRNLGYRETEDAFIESEKLQMKTDFDKIKKQYASLGLQEKVTKHFDIKLFEMVNKVDKDGLSLIDNIKQGTEKTKDVYEAYTAVKNLFKNEFRHTGGKAATKAGFLPVTDSNQTVIAGLNTRASTRNVNIIDNLALSLERSGATDKALALQQLSKNLKTLQTIPKSKERGFNEQDVADMIATQTKAANNIRDLVGNDFKLVDPANPSNTKRIGLARGGLASRR
jgi:hypothetical protein